VFCWFQGGRGEEEKKFAKAQIDRKKKKKMKRAALPGENTAWPQKKMGKKIPKNQVSEHKNRQMSERSKKKSKKTHDEKKNRCWFTKWV